MSNMRNKTYLTKKREMTDDCIENSKMLLGNSQEIFSTTSMHNISLLTHLLFPLILSTL